MLRLTVPYVRGILSWPWWRRLDSRGYCEAELVHNLYVSILEPEFTDHDLWFLSYQSRWYAENCNASNSVLYDPLLKLIAELFELVPPEQRKMIDWDGPVAEQSH
ncbi:MAG: zinc ABC transporter substrate-binding protein [Myxococcota bacterium]